MALEQFIRFTMDAVGLERILRLVQALLQIVVSFPVLLGLAASYLQGGIGGSHISGSAVKDPVLATAALLVGARERVNLGRRFFRVFRFVESFHGAHVLYSGLFGQKAREKGSKHPPRLGPWLEAFARTFSGMYLFLESLTLLDAMGVEGLAVWGPDRTRTLTVEGQRYWFLSLACSLGATLVRMARVTRDVPLPPPTEAEKEGNMGSRLVDDSDNDDGDDGNDDNKNEKKMEAFQEERERLRRIVQGRMAQRRVWRRALGARLVLLARRAVADGVDLLLPGAIVGWTPLQPGTVGVAMLATTLLTGWDVWQRCGREVAAEAEAAAAAAAAERKTN